MTAKSGAIVGWLFVVAITGGAFLTSTQSSAQTCGTNYTLKAGETLADIARAVYGNASQWSLIYYANQEQLGNGVTLLLRGCR